MTRTLRSILPVAALAVLFAAPAAAQSRSWNVCGGNAFNTCAAVEVTITGTSVQLRVWNLSGQNGTFASTVFTAIGFENVGTAQAVSGSLTMSGPVRGSDTPDAWRVRNNTQVGGGVNLDMVSSTPQSINHGIASACAPAGTLPGGQNEFWMNPCSAPAATGWIVMNFTITGTWDLDNTFLLVKGQNGPNGASTECITGGTSVNCGPPNVVPEPFTIALLGTGLAGIGGVGALKRRRRKDSDSPAV
jgi:hypothetical protein